MLNVRCPLWLCIAVFMLASCEGILSDEIKAPEFFKEAETVAVEELDQGFHAGVDEQNLVIRKQWVFEKFWESLHEGRNPLPEAPSVNFDSHMVLVSVMGGKPSGGYVVEITQAGLSGGLLGVKVQNRSPGEGCGTIGVLTNPYHMVLTEKTNASVKFFEDEIALDCSE